MFNPFSNSEIEPSGQVAVAESDALEFHDRPAAESTNVADRTALSSNPLGDRIGPYEIEGLISSGGMGTVRRAIDRRDGRAVAIKTLRRDMLGQADIRSRFLREIRLGELNHRFVMPVIDAGESDGQPYYVMPLARDSLHRLGGLFRNERDAVTIMAKVARGVGAAHRQRILHRDLKPANILIGLDGEPLVADFGLAKFLDSVDTSTLTLTGALVGTTAYMAPEQSLGSNQELTPAADVWSLGVILYELLSGERPFEASSKRSTLKRIRKIEPTPLQQWKSDLDAKLAAIVSKCLAKNPGNRYASADELADDLDAWLEGRSVVAGNRWNWPRRILEKCRSWPRSTWIGVGFAVAMVLLVVGFCSISPNESMSGVPSEKSQAVIESTMAQGLPVDLIRPRSLPCWHQWELGKNTGRLLVAPGGGTRIESATLDLLTLVKSPPKRYRLEASIRRVRSGGREETFGLFVGKRRFNDPKWSVDACVSCAIENFQWLDRLRMAHGLKMTRLGGGDLCWESGFFRKLVMPQDDVFNVVMIASSGGFYGSINGLPFDVVDQEEQNRHYKIAFNKGSLTTKDYHLSPTGSCGILVREAAIDILRLTLTPLNTEN